MALFLIVLLVMAFIVMLTPPTPEKVFRGRLFLMFSLACALIGAIAFNPPDNLTIAILSFALAIVGIAGAVRHSGILEKKQVH